MLNIEYLKELMAAEDMSLGELSKRSGISKAQLSRVMRNVRGIGPKTMVGLLQAFPGAETERLFFLR